MHSPTQLRSCSGKPAVQVPSAGLAALCAAAARMRSDAQAFREGRAAADLQGAGAGFSISLLHACLARLPLWLQGAPAAIEAAAVGALTQVWSSIGKCKMFDYIVTTT